jgi:ParB-like chromosome segregation protein Spo0J
MMKESKPNLELWPIEKIRPYPKNAKIHSPEQIAKLAALIGRFRWTNPISVQKSTGYIIAGHGRRLAAIKLGLKIVPVNVLDVSNKEADALRLADNRVTSTDYDTGVIQEELTRLNEIGFDMNIIGFDAQELDFLTADLGVIDENVFVDDISSAVEEQKQENTKIQSEIDLSTAPIADAFGFKRMTIAQSRRIRSFMTDIERKTGKSGAEALIEFIDKS